ncbi:MAG: TonB-dependent receptor [Acidobacteria bacterium]|nr:MAG: TonB-dependent receptor [Acidobacteriota bacterium]PYY24280.1 MAG: TonB-dependent receptor [Acidobacteriota bacterium]
MISQSRIPLFVLAILLMTGVAFSQTQITTGVIQGTVLDPSGAVIPGASVEAHNLDTQIRQAATSDENGRFAFLALTPGRYEVIAKKEGFSTIVTQGIDLTVGQARSLSMTMKVSTAGETVTVNATTTIDTTATESSSTLNNITIDQTPILGRKFEDLLTLTPGVSIVQGPDGDEINFAGQRGIYNNISLDGGDYNNGFFGEQVGGQRAAIDITLDAVKEFQVVATGATAEFGRTAGGVVNVITKSGTDQLHGSAFHFQRLEALSADTSDGKPLQDFHREQFGGTVGGPIVKQKMFFFGAFEQILENLNRPNLSTALGTCSGTPVVGSGDTLIGGNAECQRVALLNFFNSSRNQNEGLPVQHEIHNTALLGKYDWNVNQANNLSASYNFDRSNNLNQTFDVPTYGTSANGIEGPSKINSVNFNLFTTVSAKKLNEGHFTFSREDRPRSAVTSNVPADTAMGFGGPTSPTFRFGNPFFLGPNIDEVFKRTQVRDNFSIVSGNHTIKFGGEFLHSNNAQVFRGFFEGRYIFDSVVGFLHYATPGTATSHGFGPSTAECANGTFLNQGETCPDGFKATASPLLLYLQGAPTGLSNLTPGASDINNNNYAFFLQDKWQFRPNITFNYGLRWEAQTFPDPVIPPSKAAYGTNLSDSRFPSDGKIPNATKMFQPRIGVSWDIRNNQKSVVRASWGIYNAELNMLTQVGAITTNGVQQQTLFAGNVATCPLASPPADGSCPGVPPAYTQVFISPNGPKPQWPDFIHFTPPAGGAFPFQPGVTVFNRNYNNPRTYTGNFAFQQELATNWTGYLDLTISKGVYLTRFVNPNTGAALPIKPTDNVDTVSYAAGPFTNLGAVTDTQSTAHSLYRGMTVGGRKSFSQNYQLEFNYTLSEDLDDDSNERDPFTFRYFNRFDFRKDYAFSDRDERHRFNMFAYMKLPYGIEFSPRIQAHTAQPITDNPLGTGTGAPCSSNNSRTRVVNGIDCGRNHLRKDNGYFSFDWRGTRPFHFGDRYALIPQVEMFNSFNNKNNVNPLVSPALFNFDGFLREGVGDPLQVQLSVKFLF